MAEETMNNIEIRQFQRVQGLNDTDYVVLSLENGTSALIDGKLMKSVLTQKITPSISDEGVWLIGGENTEVVAEGQTPQFRKTELGIEWKYTSQPQTAWTLLVPIGELLFKFDELTDSQRELITLQYEDLTDAEIAELQKPANDMIAVLEATNESVTTAETAREQAEEARATEYTELKTDLLDVTTKAETATTNADKATTAANTAADNADKSAEGADASATGADEAAERANTAAQAADTATEEANSARDAANTAASRANESADAADTATRNAEAATADAQDTADHPTYIGDDNYVYEWNKSTKTYDKTAKYVRGEAFSIKRVYDSVEKMYADTTTEFKEGDFALIDTGNVEDPENGQLFVRSAVGSWDFLVDLSGAIGFTGKTPQLFIGNVAVGSGKDSAAVSLTADGVDTNGNPQYRIHYTIPCLAYEDLTSEQIAELQRPASDMIAQLQATDNAVKAAEAIRVQTEDTRIVEEQKRVDNETIRQQNEGTRQTNETERIDNESERIGNETTRQQNEEDRKTDYAEVRAGAVEATDNANQAASQARNLPKIQDGTWWLFDVNQNIYVDSGYAVSSDYQLTREKIENVFTGNITSHWHDIYINKVEGMGLSANDFTDALKEKLDGLENYDDSALIAEVGKKADATDIPTKVGQLENDASYATTTQLSEGLASKQPVIADLEAIRSGAALGATALQSVPSEYVTTTAMNTALTGKVDKDGNKVLSTNDFTNTLKEKLEGLENYDDTAITAVVNTLREDFDALVNGDTTTAIASFNEVVSFLAGIEDSETLEGILAGIGQQLSAKQDKNLYFTNLVANNWVADDTYPKFGYRCDLPTPGVTEAMYAEVIFAVEQFTSVDYAPVCETKQDMVSIWAAVTDTITIPTIIIYK